VSVNLDVVIDADTPQAPFGEAIGLDGQRLEVGPIELFEQGAAGDAEPAQRALLVEMLLRYSLGNRGSRSLRDRRPDRACCHG
jgi:hypothetical protein